MIRLFLLGPPEMQRDDGADDAVALRSPKTLALLARMAIGSPDHVRRDQLVGLLWPELNDARARNALSKALHHARRALGEETLVTRGHEELAMLPSHCWVDLWELEEALQRGALDVALARFDRGPLLEGVHLSDAPDFEPWLDGVRERLRLRLLQATLARADVLEASGAPAEALPYLARAATLAPADEMIVRRQMRLLDRIGDRGRAKQLYEQLVVRLRRDLELEPSPETVALLASITERRDAAAPPAHFPSASTSSSPAPSSDGEARSAAPPLAVGIEHGRRSERARRLTFAAVALTIVFAVAATRWPRPTPAPPVGVGRRVLVVPFTDRTGDTTYRELGAMIADFIAQGIHRADLLEVVDPLSSVIAVAQHDEGASDAERVLAAARRAGAGTVVSGAYYRRGDSLLFQAEVLDVARRRRLASVDSVVVGGGDAVAAATRLREGTAGVLATIFDPKLASIGAAKGPPPSLAAYREFRRGLELFPKSDEAALPYFLAAARIDSSFAQALIWASFAYGNTGRLAERDSLERILERRREGLQGLDRYAVDGNVLMRAGRIQEALQALQAAAEESPGSHWSHNTSNVLLSQNRLEAALAYSRQVDPEHGWAGSWFPYWKNLTNALHLLGRHEEELKESRRAVQLGDDLGLVGLELRALIALGRVDEAERRLEELVRVTPPGPYLMQLVRILGEELRAHGHRQSAVRAFKRVDSIAASASVQPNGVIGVMPSWAKLERAWSLYEIEQVGGATRELDALDVRDLDAWSAASAGVLRALIGASSRSDLPSARALDLIEGAMPEGRGLYERARLAAVAGDREGAMQLLRAMLDGRQSSDVVMWLHRDHEWSALRDDAAFRALVMPR